MKAIKFIPFLFVSCFLVLAMKCDPPVTITLPGGAKCKGEVKTTISAEIAPDQHQRATLTVKVCVFCDDKPIANVTGITGKILSENLPTKVKDGLIFRETGENGCVIQSFVLKSSSLRGQEVTVTVKDSKGETVSTETVEIK